MFLDREPYIRYWRPTYEIFGPFLRAVKSSASAMGALFLSRSSKQSASMNAHIAKLQADHQVLYAALEQLLLSMVADRQATPHLAGVEARLARIEEGQERLSATLKQVLDSTMAERQVAVRLATIEERLNTLATKYGVLAERQGELAAQYKAVWAAIEEQILLDSRRPNGVENVTGAVK